MSNYKGGFVPGNLKGYQYEITKNFPGLSKMTKKERCAQKFKQAVDDASKGVKSGFSSPAYRKR